MTDKQKAILKVLLELSSEERKELIRETQSFETKTFSERRSMSESVNKAFRSLGPITGSCTLLWKIKGSP